MRSLSFVHFLAMDVMAIYQMGIQVARRVSDPDRAAAGSAQPAVQVDVASAAASGPPPESPEHAVADDSAASGPPPDAASGPPPEGADAVSEAAPGPPPRRAAAPPRQRKRKRQVRVLARNILFRRLSLQAKLYNASGQARTRDHLLPEPPRPAVPKAGARRFAQPLLPPPKVKGTGAWKRATPEYICKVGFAPSHVSLRTLCSKGASHRHARGCNLVLSDIIMERQQARMREREQQSKRTKFDFYITNNMFDETKLFCRRLCPWPETAGGARGLWPGDMEAVRQLLYHRPGRDTAAQGLKAIHGCHLPPDCRSA